MLQEGLQKLQEYAYNEREQDLEDALSFLRDASASFLPPVASQELSEIVEELEGHKSSGTLPTFIHEFVDRLDIIVKEL